MRTGNRHAHQFRNERGVTTTACVMLYWLPLGAGGHCIRRNGRLFEAFTASHEHRPVRDLYHSALEVCLDAERFVVEMTPVMGGGAANRGVVCEGPVGSRLLVGSGLFRYKVRRWLDGPQGPGRGLAGAGLTVDVTLSCGDDYFGEHEATRQRQ